MRFSTIFLSATLAALSVAQSNGTASVSPTAAVTPTGTYTLTPAQSSQASCLTACPADDPACRAACIVIDEGDFSKQNRTIDCIGECPKGNGTETDNLNFENCQKACIAAPAPASTTADLTNTRTGAGAESTGAAGETKTGGSNTVKPTGSSTVSGSGSAASPTQSGSSADNLRVGAMGAFIGLGSLALIFGL